MEKEIIEIQTEDAVYSYVVEETHIVAKDDVTDFTGLRRKPSSQSLPAILCAT